MARWRQTSLGRMLVFGPEDRPALAAFNRRQFVKMGLLPEEKKMYEKMKPTRNLVLCRASGERDQMTPGGLHIPDTVKGRVDRAEVLAVGEGWYTAKGVLVPCCVKPGQVVLFDPYRLTWVEGTEHNVATPAAKPGDLFLIHDDAILAEVV